MAIATSKPLEMAIEVLKYLEIYEYFDYVMGAETKGNRKYFTVGAGFRMNVFSLDAGYVISTAASNPLDQTLRVTLGFDLDGIKDILSRGRRRY